MPGVVEGPILTAVRERGEDTGIIYSRLGVGSELAVVPRSLVSLVRVVDARPIRLLI